MSTEEMSNLFDTMVSSYRRFKDFDKMEMPDSIEFDEYEKSLYLSMAQDELVVNLYSGKNIYGEAFESTEEMRRYLDELVEDKVYTTGDQGMDSGLSFNSVFFTLPNGLAFIVYEAIALNDARLGCYAGEVASVQPVTHDEYTKIRKNPFRGGSRYRALHIDAGAGKVEIISKYSFDEYHIRYVKYPDPIVLENMPNGLTVQGVSTKTECQLNPLLHQTIVKRAVQMALTSKGIKVNS